jgi:hypothetical protein
MFGRKGQANTSEATDEFTFLLMPGQGGRSTSASSPSAPEYVIASDDHLRICLRSPTADPLQVVSGSGSVTIWPAPTAEVRATNATGEELEFLI